MPFLLGSRSRAFALALLLPFGTEGIDIHGSGSSWHLAVEIRLDLLLGQPIRSESTRREFQMFLQRLRGAMDRNVARRPTSDNTSLVRLQFCLYSCSLFSIAVKRSSKLCCFAVLSAAHTSPVNLILRWKARILCRSPPSVQPLALKCLPDYRERIITTKRHIATCNCALVFAKSVFPLLVDLGVISLIRTSTT